MNTREQAKTPMQQLLAGDRKKEIAALIGQVDQAQIEAWKKEYPLGIYGLKGAGRIAYFQVGDRFQVNDAMSKASVEAALDMYQEYARLTFIGGCEELLTQDHYFKGIAQKIKSDMEGEPMEVVNF